MPLPRRLLLAAALRWGGALGLAAAVAPGAAAAAAAGPALAPAGSDSPEDPAGLLRRRLEICRPPGDPLAELLRRNAAFAAVWQEAAGSGDPLERARLLQEHGALHCQIRPGALAEGQRPWAAVLGCADSRVAPEWLFAAGSGELFEVRCAGNTPFDAGIASLEYAVAELEVPLILVLGHGGCGAVAAALGRDPLTPLLEELVAPIRAAVGSSRDPAAAVAANARATARALPQRSALLAAAQAAGQLRIAAAVADIASGRVTVL
ncbi:MAG: carbonic anhydrase [Synechococcaceae cyanobacterium]